MGEKKTDIEVLLSYLPFLRRWYNIAILYVMQLTVFIGVMFFYWWISSRVFYGAILGQIIISTLLVFHFIYIADNAHKIRERYLEKYGSKLAGQYFWFRYQSYTIPIISAAYYFPIILKTDYFLPAITPVPSHFLTDSLFPVYIAIPLGIIIIVVGYFLRGSSKVYGRDVDNYLYVIYPEKSYLIKEDVYGYIRNPQYLSRGVIAVGFGVIANSLSAIIVGFIHFLSYCAIIPAEDRELSRRFGEEFDRYKGCVPALFPRFDKLGEFIRLIFYRRWRRKN